MEFKIKPGDASGMHSHPANIVYALCPAKLRITTLQGTREVEKDTGDIQWSDGGSHDVVNIGNTVHHGIIIELK